MATTIYAEGALYGPEGRELDHPNYKRKVIAISVQTGFHGVVVWTDLVGAFVSFFALLIVEKMVMKTDPIQQLLERGNTVSVHLDIPGKGVDYPDPVAFKVQTPSEN
jgi:hypothetical protein